MAPERFGRILDAQNVELDEIAEEVARTIFSGGTVILSNDTSYLIGCDPYDYEAVDRVYAAVGRPDNRPLTMHVATAAEFLEYAADNPLAIHAAKRLLPAPVILLIRKPAFISDELAAGLQTLAFRVPDDSFARRLLDRCGPIAGTTASPRGGPRYLGGADRSMLPSADLLVEHGPTRYNSESSIVDLSGGHARLLREGIVSEQRLTELLGPIERPTVKIRSFVLRQAQDDSSG
ncbi:MAG TPA: L-threonylcarbamoyladenylate synthase [Candidatus Cybelea sp.]|jgi:L-threonylcarbamoyladenylate synthase|nr:L-threonylcarbamoyladenylate synthase [Candidatus Cybelea sp.]